MIGFSLFKACNPLGTTLESPDYNWFCSLTMVLWIYRCAIKYDLLTLCLPNYISPKSRVKVLMAISMVPVRELKNESKSSRFCRESNTEHWRGKSARYPWTTSPPRIIQQ